MYLSKNCFHVAKLKKCQDKISRLAASSVRHLIQDENGTFFPGSF